jgi:hypothetical protein
MGFDRRMMISALVVAWLSLGLAGCSSAEIGAGGEDPAAWALDPEEVEPGTP